MDNKWIPNADIREYSFDWITEDDHDAPAVVAHIRNSSNPHIDIPVVVDDEYMYNNNLAGCAINVSADNYEGGCRMVIARKLCMDILENEDEMFMIWHEIGHYHTLHYFMDYAMDSLNGRVEYYKENKVPPAEYAADLMAYYYIGKEAVLNTMKRLIRERNSYVDKGDEYAVMTWTELRLRRNKIREIDNNDTVINELLKICSLTEAAEI